LHALYFCDFCGQVSKRENKGRKYCANITVITITDSITAKTGPQNGKFKGSRYVSTKNRNIKGHAKIYGFAVVVNVIARYLVCVIRLNLSVPNPKMPILYLHRRGLILHQRLSSECYLVACNHIRRKR